MKTSKLVLILFVLAILGFWWYWWSVQNPQTAPQVQGAPSTAMGINGSANQGNLGGTNTGTVQQPQDGTGAPPSAGQGVQSDGSGVSDNFALGIDGSAALGSYLIAYNGLTVYTYAKDTAGHSNCTGQCAANWPPYIVPAGSRLNLQAGVTGAIDTIVRADGSTQVTYKGMPLYFYAKDQESGQTNGQGIGGVWYVVKP